MKKHSFCEDSCWEEWSVALQLEGLRWLFWQRDRKSPIGSLGVSENTGVLYGRTLSREAVRAAHWEEQGFKDNMPWVWETDYVWNFCWGCFELCFGNKLAPRSAVIQARQPYIELLGTLKEEIEQECLLGCRRAFHSGPSYDRNKL